MDQPPRAERARRAAPRHGRTAARSSSEHEPGRSRLDEAAAEEARVRLRDRGIIPIEPDERVGVMLRSDERLVAVRHAVSLERRAGWQDPDDALRGDLYVTTQRLLHVGRTRVEWPLADIREAVVADDALMLVVSDYRGIRLGVEDPRVLRVEIAAARHAARLGGPRPDQAPSR